MKKFDLNGMAIAINYYDFEMSFYKGDGNELDLVEDIFAKGLCEDDYPFTIEDFEKMGYGFSKAVYKCNDGDNSNDVTYVLDDTNDCITIQSDNFTMKECFIIIDMINRQLVSEKRGLFVSFGNDLDDTHVLFPEESTAFGRWWNDFIKLYQSRLKKNNKLSKILIFKADYETDDNRIYTKDRVIHIILV